MSKVVIDTIKTAGGALAKKAFVKPNGSAISLGDLYHITTRANYLKMQCDKTFPSILPSLDGCFGKQSGLKGVFTTTRENIRNWGISENWRGHLGFNLLKHAAKRKNNLVCLRIPISSLDKSKITVRSQNNLFSFINRKGGNAYEAYNGTPLVQSEGLNSTDALEYIYTGGAIPIENVEVVGRANAKEIAKRLPPKATPSMWFEETMKDLFRNNF